jgi:YD repeat-containing protein
MKTRSSPPVFHGGVQTLNVAISRAVLKRIDAKGRNTEYGYNDQDLRVQTTHPDGAIERSVFDD